MSVDSYWFWLVMALAVILAVLVIYGLIVFGKRFHEEHFLEPEERWRRRYDRNLKNHFKDY